MKKSTFFISFLALPASFLGPLSGVVQAYPKTVAACTSMPTDLNTPCLIEPESYEVSIYRVELCQNDPFPSTSNQADFAAGKCITLFNGGANAHKGDLANEGSYNLPSTGAENITSGTYNHISMILKNEFSSSGSYTFGGTTWKTNGEVDEEPFVTTDENVSPIKQNEVFLTSDYGWRGDDDSDNDYCLNGATAARCDASYNGYEVTGIGVDATYQSSYGSGLEYIYYRAELQTPVTLLANASGFIDVTVDNSYELFADGTTVRGMFIAPFIFQAEFQAE